MSHTLHTLQMPLHGVRVVEFEGIGPGPLAARMLADMGAEVITLTRASRPLRRGGWAGRWRTRCAAARRSRSST
jgi:crotonobetainyl-CoA:carnitine CoA-transferase CaiB-like acyl-CoA transferase